MSERKNNRILLGSGILMALTSSLCCIVPLLAIIGGAGSSVAAFGWAEPLRPYLLVATLLVLGIAFYQAYKPQKKDDCGCDPAEKKSWLRSKTFLWVVASLSIVLSSFPYYAKYFQPKPAVIQSIEGKDSMSVREAVIHIRGMSCEACEGHVNNALLQNKGVRYVNTSFEKGVSIVSYDSNEVSLSQLVSVIESKTGYKVKQ